MSQNLKLKKKGFVQFLDSLSKVSDLAVLTSDPERILSFVANSDKTLYVVGSYYLSGVSDLNLNCPSLKKLKNLISLIKGDEVSLEIEENHILHKSGGVKFKYHLHEDGVITSPKLSLSKFENYEYDIELDIDKDFIAKILKISSNIDSSKVYFTKDGDTVLCEIKDDSKPNSDLLSFPVMENVDFDINFIFSMDNLRAISLSPTTKFRFNSKMGISSIISNFGDYKIEYVSPSLTV